MSLETLFWLDDNSGVKQLKILSVNKTNRKYYLLGDLITASPKKYKLNKKHLKKKRTLFFALITGISRWTHRLNGFFIKFQYNKALLISNGFKFLGTRIYGAIPWELKNSVDYSLFKKLSLLASKIL